VNTRAGVPGLAACRGFGELRLNHGDEAHVSFEPEYVVDVAELGVEGFERVEQTAIAEATVAAHDDLRVREARLDRANEPHDESRRVTIVARVAGSKANANESSFAVEDD
jgi:hypothetical protein